MWLVPIENFNSLLFVYYFSGTDQNPTDAEHLLCVRPEADVFRYIMCGTMDEGTLSQEFQCILSFLYREGKYSFGRSLLKSSG